eukprot:scaffold613_cov243-Pinguiococcus_pyrenoidosus.AAC.27
MARSAGKVRQSSVLPCRCALVEVVEEGRSRRRIWAIQSSFNLDEKKAAPTSSNQRFGVVLNGTVFSFHHSSALQARVFSVTMANCRSATSAAVQRHRSPFFCVYSSGRDCVGQKIHLASRLAAAEIFSGAEQAPRLAAAEQRAPNTRGKNLSGGLLAGMLEQAARSQV